jgi:tryptophan synthase alpha chain
MNRITQLFKEKPNNVLNIYYTAGFPNINDTTTVLEALQESGADIAEIGMPYSDPVADGETIQQSNQIALDNGMSLKVLFQQLEGIRAKVSIPIILMGYINPVLQFGIEDFCKKCQEVGVDGLILPDLPMDEYYE